MPGKFTDERIKELAAKWIDKTITPDEQREFAEWYNQGQDAPVKIPVEFSENEDVLKSRILSKINTSIKADRKKRLPKTWLSAAASLLLLCGFGAYYYHYKLACNTQIAQQRVHKSGDVKPGSSKAILVLANGVKIDLDSTKKGWLATQGKIQLKKNKDGQITYEQANRSTQDLSLIYNTITVPKGGQYQVLLSDSTKVWLNSASSITFPVAFSKTERRITISGEVYLEVAKNKHLPFRVITGKQTIEVLGTHFNVNAYPDEPSIKTTLAEGSVKVTANGKTVILKPLQQADVLNEGFEKIDVNTADLDDVLAWKNGIFQFDNADVPFITREIARWYDVQIKFEGEVPKRKFTGSISRNVNLSEFLNMLKYTGVDFKTDDRVITVMNK